MITVRNSDLVLLFNWTQTYDTIFHRNQIIRSLHFFYWSDGTHFSSLDYGKIPIDLLIRQGILQRMLARCSHSMAPLPPLLNHENNAKHQCNNDSNTNHNQNNEQYADWRIRCQLHHNLTWHWSLIQEQHPVIRVIFRQNEVERRKTAGYAVLHRIVIRAEELAILHAHLQIQF